MNSGIYKITCTTDGKFYIGRTVDFAKRRMQHLNDLKRNAHKNIILQSCYNKHGKESLVFELLEPIADINDQIVKEQEYIDRYIGSELCININRSAKVFCDVPFTDERRRKISKARKNKIGQKRTPEQRKHISDALKGHVISEETRQKISESHKGKKLTEEHKQKLREYRGEKSYWYGKSGSQVPQSIPVWQLDPVTKAKIKRFESGTDAARSFGANDGSNLRKALKKGIKAYGYYWVEDKCQSTIESTATTVNE